MKKICLIGTNINNSKSPLIHKYISENFNIDYKYFLEKCDNIDYEYLKNNYDGFNVTMPFKNKITEYIDFSLYNSINTVTFKNSKSYGTSTDGDGFCKSFKETFLTDFENKKIILLGYGGAGQSVYESLKKENPKSVYVFSRKKDENLYSYNMLNELVKDADIIINTTNQSNSLVEKKYINNNMYLCDVNYKKNSELLTFGTKTMNGFGMLFYQAVKSCEFWFETELKIYKPWKETEKELMKLIKN